MQTENPGLGKRLFLKAVKESDLSHSQKGGVYGNRFQTGRPRLPP
jgi:hypothetical protein